MESLSFPVIPAQPPADKPHPEIEELIPYDQKITLQFFNENERVNVMFILYKLFKDLHQSILGKLWPCQLNYREEYSMKRSLILIITVLK